MNPICYFTKSKVYRKFILVIYYGLVISRMYMAMGATLPTCQPRQITLLYSPEIPALEIAILTK